MKTKPAVSHCSWTICDR